MVGTTARGLASLLIGISGRTICGNFDASSWGQISQGCMMLLSSKDGLFGRNGPLAITLFGSEYGFFRSYSPYDYSRSITNYQPYGPTFPKQL